MEINVVPEAQRLKDVTYHQADQTDPQANVQVCARDGPFDIIVDDGAHTMEAIRVSMHAMLGCVKPGGFYIVEDLHTAYWPHGYGGGLNTEGSVMNIFKDMMDVVNRQHFASPAHIKKHGVDPQIANVTNNQYSLVPGDERVTGVSCFKSVCALEILGNNVDVHQKRATDERVATAGRHVSPNRKSFPHQK